MHRFLPGESQGMELSRFLKAYPYADRDDRTLLFSTRNAAKILITQEALRRLQHGVASPDNTNVLSRLGLLVPDHYQEEQDVLTFFDRCRQKSPELNLTVVLNLDCNFACLYCYEGERKGKRYLSADTAGALIAFATERFQGKQSLHIDFYGGEPLLSTDLIISISQELQPLVRKAGGSYRFTLVTNGSLLKRRVVEELLPWGLYSVRITLDGPAENHNRFRPFVSGAGSFDTIIRNIKEICSLVKVGLGGNYEQDNYRKFPTLLDYLLNQGLTPDRISGIKFDPINRRPAGDAALVDYHGGCCSINEPWLFEASTVLREEILRRGYSSLKAGPIFCMVELPDSYVIHYDGTIYKCPALIGRPEFAVGDVRSGVRDYTESHRLGNWKNPTCLACAYLPLCFGGCRYSTFVQSGNFDALDCKKAYFNACLETIIRQDLAYSTRTPDRQPFAGTGRVPDLSDLFTAMDRMVAHHFPDQRAGFQPPSLEKIISCYRNADKLIQTYACGRPYNTAQGPPMTGEGLISTAIIRYFDDFIDTALWPVLDTFDPAMLEKAFAAFLQDAVEAMRRFDPDLPMTIIDLPRLEMHLALHPGQKTFDDSFKKLFECKSYDLSYIYRKIHTAQADAVEPGTLMTVALMDYLRDFSAEAIAADTDLNLYTYIRDNGINPERLIRYLIEIYRLGDPARYQQARERGLFAGLGCDDETAEPARNESAVPIHEHFAMLFERAIIMLKKLPQTSP